VERNTLSTSILLVKQGCRTGPSDNIGWRKRFLGSLKVYKYCLCTSIDGCCWFILAVDVEKSQVNAGMSEKIGIFTGNQLLRSGIGIPVSGSVRYRWSQISPALPSYEIRCFKGIVQPLKRGVMSGINR
jgi:hypothetical protein